MSVKYPGLRPRAARLLCYRRRVLRLPNRVYNMTPSPVQEKTRSPRDKTKIQRVRILQLGEDCISRRYLEVRWLLLTSKLGNLAVVNNHGITLRPLAKSSDSQINL